MGLGQVRATIKASPAPHSLIHFSCLFRLGNQVSLKPFPYVLFCSCRCEVLHPVLGPGAACHEGLKTGEGLTQGVFGTCLRRLLIEEVGSSLTGPGDTLQHHAWMRPRNPSASLLSFYLLAQQVPLTHLQWGDELVADCSSHVPVL